MAAFGISRSVLYCDDGLQAGHHTGFGCLLIDDGLTATSVTSTVMTVCGDGGLQATGPTQSWPRCF